MCGHKIKKNPLLGVVALCARSELPSAPHAEYQLPQFPQAFGPYPFPGYSPQTYTPTCDIFQASRRRHRHARNRLYVQHSLFNMMIQEQDTLGLPKKGPWNIIFYIYIDVLECRHL